MWCFLFFYSQIHNKGKKKTNYRQDCSAAGGKVDRAILSVGQAHTLKDEMKESKLVTTTAISSTEPIFCPNNYTIAHFKSKLNTVQQVCCTKPHILMYQTNEFMFLFLGPLFSLWTLQDNKDWLAGHPLTPLELMGFIIAEKLPVFSSVSWVIRE